MKKLMVTVIMLFTVVAFAQQRGARGMNEKSPTEVAQAQTKNLKKELNLDKDQEKKVFDLVLSQAEKWQANRKEMMAAREAGKRPTEGQREKMRAQMEEQRKEANEAMQAILTTEQMEKWTKLQEEMMAKRRDRGGRNGY